jgi:peptidoglycan hydrolase CwlO-like protein
VIGAAAVQTAGAWVHSNVPASAPTLTTAQLQDQLSAEEARSNALQAQVDALLNQAGQFNSALSAAGSRVASDLEKAAALRAQLAAEQKQLAALKAAAKAAAAHRSTATPPPTHSTTGASGGSGGDDGGD